jgi:ribosomal protein S18 acetylase RimI-like enzyme
MQRVTPPFLIRLAHLSKNAATVLSSVLLVVVFELDWLASPRVPFGPYYLLPIALAAWCVRGRFTAFMVVAASLARTLVLCRQVPPHLMLYFTADIISSLCVYAGVASLLGRLKQAYHLLAEEAGTLTEKVEQAEKRRWLDASIRRAVLADVDHIVELAALGGADGDLSKDVTTTVRQAMLRGVYADSIRQGTVARPLWSGGQAVVPVEFWVSQINGQIAGFLMVMGLDGSQGAERELHAIVTAKDYRGVGVGTAMVDWFCSHYYGRKLFAAVMPDSKMHRMLKRRGFFRYAEAKEGYVIVERVEWPKEKGLLPGEAAAA